MATLENSPLLIPGQSWATWAEKIENKGSSSASDKSSRRGDTDSMKLKKEDMALYGLCPAQDEFYLVVCEMCGHLVKPQALGHHMDIRHSKCHQQQESLSDSDTQPSQSPVLSVCSTSTTHSMESPNKARPSQHKHGGENLTKKKKNKIKKKSNIRSSPTVKLEKLKPGGSMLSGLLIGNNEASRDILTDHKERTENVAVHKTSPAREACTSQSLTSGATTVCTNAASNSGRTIAHSAMKNSSVSVSTTTVFTTVSANSTVTTSTSHKHRHHHRDSSVSNHNKLVTPVTSATSMLASPTTSKPSLTFGVITSCPLQSPISSPVCSPDSAASATEKLNTTPASMPPPDFPFQKEKSIPLKDRLFDANKHCGVIVPETGKQCTRSLTCKSHALSMRRKVPGRRKSFDELLQEHRDNKEAMLQHRAKQGNNSASGSSKKKKPPANNTQKAHVQVSTLTGMNVVKGKTSGNLMTPGGMTMPIMTSPPGQKSHVIHKDGDLLKIPLSAATGVALGHATMDGAGLSVSVSSVTTVSPGLLSPNSLIHPTPATRGHRSEPLPVVPKEEPPVPETYSSRMSTDGEDSGDEGGYNGSNSKSHGAYLPYHPRPAAVNTFGARIGGGGCYLFNRRSDFLRVAFSTAVDQHLKSSQKKRSVEHVNTDGSNNVGDVFTFSPPISESTPTHHSVNRRVFCATAAGRTKSKAKCRTASPRTSTPTSTGHGASNGLLNGSPSLHPYKRRKQNSTRLSSFSTSPDATLQYSEGDMDTSSSDHLHTTAGTSTVTSPGSSVVSTVSSVPPSFISTFTTSEQPFYTGVVNGQFNHGKGHHKYQNDVSSNANNASGFNLQPVILDTGQDDNLLFNTHHQVNGIVSLNHTQMESSAGQAGHKAKHKSQYAVFSSSPGRKRARSSSGHNKHTQKSPVGSNVSLSSSNDTSPLKQYCSSLHNTNTNAAAAVIIDHRISNPTNSGYMHNSKQSAITNRHHHHSPNTKGLTANLHHSVSLIPIVANNPGSVNNPVGLSANALLLQTDDR